MESKNVLISVIVPTYKRSDKLSRAVDSILNQTFENVEIIIVNDNIPDSEFDVQTKKVLKDYQNNSKIKVVETNGGVGGGAARNIAIGHCTGEYVAFLDDDDRFLPDKLEKQYEFMVENKLDMCYQDIQWNNEDEKVIEYRRLDYVKDFSKENLIREHILHSISPTAIYMIKREKLLKTDGFGEVIMGQDWFLMLRCIEADLKIGYMPGAYVIQYLHSGERISLGTNKIIGENNLYDYKKKYYKYLTKQDRKYVDFRHYAVLSFASLRSKRYFDAFKYSIKTVFVSPKNCFLEAKRYFGGKKKKGVQK